MATLGSKKKFLDDIDAYVDRRFSSPEENDNPIDAYVDRRFAGVKPEGDGDKKDDKGFLDTAIDVANSALGKFNANTPQAYLKTLLGSAAFETIEDVFGVRIPQAAKEAYINRQTAENLAQIMTGIEQPLALGMKGLGALAKGYADNADARNNPKGIENPTTDASAIRMFGELLDYGGDYFNERATSPERQQAFHEKKKDYGTPADMIANGTLGEYLTDPGGFGQDLYSGLGNALFFMTLAKAFPTITAGGLMPQGISAALGGGTTNLARGLLGKAGLHNAARILGGKTAGDLLSAGIEFAPTMGLGQAITNAGTIVDALRQQGYSDAEIYERQKDLIADELPADMAFAGLTGGVVKGALGRAIAGRNASIPKLAAAQIPGLGLETTAGFYSNLYQMMLANKYSGKPYGELFGEHTPEEADAANIGALMGGLFGAGGIPSAVRGSRVADARRNAYTEHSQDVADRYHDARDEAPEIARQAYRDAKSVEGLRGLARREGISDDLFNLIVDTANEVGVPADRLVAQAIAESNGRQDDVSPAGAIGVMQLTPETAEELGVDPHDLKQNILGGARYLKQMYDATGDWSLAHAAYNAGLGAVQKFGGIPYGEGYEETEPYVNRINGLVGENSGTEDGRQTQANIRTGLDSAKKQLDGAQMDNGTVGCVEAVTKILAHVHPEFQKMVDDGVVNTVEGENSLHNRLEKMGIEIVPFDESNVEQGDIIFYDGEQTYQHVLVADHKDADGNWRVFGNSSSANKVMEQPLYQGQTPAWIAKVSKLSGDDGGNVMSTADKLFAQRFQDRMNPSQQQQRIPEPEPIKTRYIDTRAEDDATQKLFDQVAQERLAKAVESKNVDEASFWSRIFNDDGTFNNTKENRDAIRERYGDALRQWMVQSLDTAETPQEQPAQTQQGKPQPKPVQETPKGNKGNSVLRDNPVITAGNKYLEELRATGKQEEAHKAFQLLSALQKGDAVEVENILKKNGRENLIQQAQQESQTQPAQQEQQPAQPQENVVQNNTTPENVLARADTALADMKRKLNGLQQKLNDPNNTPEEKNATRFLIDRLQSRIQTLQEARDSNSDTAKIIQTLEEYGYGDKSSSMQETQTQQSQEATQEQGEQKTEQKNKNAPKTGLEKAIKAAHGELKDSSKEKRQSIGRALTFIADNYGVEIPQAEREALREKGNSKLIQKWREELMYRGHLPPKSAIKKGKQDTSAQQQEQTQQEQAQPTQETQQQPSLIEQARAIVKEATDAAQKTWDEIKQGYKERGEQAKQEQAKRDEEEQAKTEQRTRAEQQNEQAARDMSDAISAKNLYQAGVIAERNGVPNEILNPDKKATPTQSQEAPSPWDLLVTSSREVQNRLMDSGRQRDAGRIEDAIQSRDAEKLERLVKGYDTMLRGKQMSGTSSQLIQPATTQSQNQTKASDIASRLSSQKALHDKQDTELAQLQKRQQENDVARALAEPSADEYTRKQQGAHIIRMVDSPWFKEKYGGINLSKPLQRALRGGKAKGIEEAQRLLAERGVPVHGEQQQTTQEQTKQETQEKSEPKTKAEEKPQGKEEHKPQEEKQKTDEDVASKETTEEPKEGKQDEATEKTPTEKDRPAEKDNTKDAESGQTQEEVTKPKAEEKAEPKEAAAKYNENAGKASTEGKADTRIVNLIEDDSKLTPRQKLLKDFAAKLGVQLQFFDNPDGRFHGAFVDGITFLNVNSKKGLDGVFWHESFHWLKANNPELYAKLVEAAGITDAQRKAFLERTGRKDLTTDEAIDEEILADQMDDVAKRSGLLQSLAGKNRGVVERVVQWLKDTMNKFIDMFRNPQGRLTTAQAKALVDQFGKIARDIKDADGKPIFRVNNRTGDIEVVEGRKAPQTTTAKATAAAQSPAAKYSIDNSDNSNEAWGKRLKHWVSGLTGSKKQSPDRIHQEMKQRLMDLSNMKIAAGHLPKGMQEQIDEVANVIRTKKEYDWVKILPNVGNAVAKQLGITQSVDMSNCIAKYLYEGIVDEQSAEGKEFIQAMRNNEEMRDKIIATQEVFGRWREMDDVQKQIASIQFGKPTENLTLKERGVKFWRELRRQLFDAQAPIGYQVEHFEKATGMKLADSLNPATAFRRLSGTQGIALSMIDGGREEVEVLQGKIAGVNFDNFQTVAETLYKAGAFESDQNYKEFSDFVTLKQILTLHKHNDNNRATQAEIRKKIAQLKEDLEFAGTKKERTRLEQAIERRERALSDLQDSIKELPEAWDTKEKCENALAKLTSKHGDKFEKAQKALVEYTKALMAMRVEAGLMSTRRFNELLHAFPDYVPLHRIFDENPDIEADSDKHMVGSGKDIIDPIQAIMDNTFDIVHRCEKNKAKQLLATLARFDGVGRIFEEVEPGSNDGTIINFYEGGKRKCLQCADPALVKAVNNLAPAPMNWAMKLFRVPTLVLKGATTAWSPAFMARNIFRDPQDAYVYSAKNGGNVFKDALKYMTPLFALKCTFDTLCGNNKTYEALINKLNMEVDKKLLAEYRIYGGSQSTFFDFDADVKADLFAKYTKGKWKRFASPKGVIQLLEKLGELSERGTRLQRFKQVKDNLKTQHGGINIYDDLVTAAFESRDLMDFARHGEAGHTWNTMAAFANPTLQGMDKLIRTFDVKKLKMFGGTEETQKQWMSSLARLAIGSILPALVLTMLHKDEDWYKDDLQPWEKDAYWIISEDLKIPKGADVATRFFSNLAEALVNSDNESIKAKRILMPLYDGLPNLLPTAMAPVIECLFIKDLFKGTPIIPMRERYLSATPEKQYDSSNSNFAIWLGNKLGVSPRQIDHLIYGYTGNLGKGFMKTVDTGLHTTGLSDKPVQPWTQAWIPVIGGFLREPYANSKIVREYYTELDKQRSYVEAYKLDKKNRKKDAKLDEDFDRGWYARLTGAEKAMGEFAKRERAILDNPNLTSEQVEEQRRKIQEKRIALLRRIFKYKRAQ